MLRRRKHSARRRHHFGTLRTRLPHGRASPLMTAMPPSAGWHGVDQVTARAQPYADRQPRPRPRSARSADSNRSMKPGRWSAMTDARGWVAPGGEVKARHETVARLHDVVPDIVPEYRAAAGKAVHRYLAADRTEDGDDLGRRARPLTHPQTRVQRAEDMVGMMRGSPRRPSPAVAPLRRDSRASLWSSWPLAAHRPRPALVV